MTGNIVRLRNPATQNAASAFILRGILMFFEVQYTCRKSKINHFCGKVLRVLQSIFPAAMSGETANFRKILAFS